MPASMLEKLIYIVIGLITVLIPGLYIYLALRKEKRARTTLNKSLERGMGEPASLHPVIDPKLCIGAGACVLACPEGDILGLIDNKAALLKPSNCIGHGECQAACPVGAISLVFGSEKRGVDLPFIKGNFETNVPGIYIAGELGGMGLIRNAVTQGRQAVEHIAKSLERKTASDIYDLAIIGAGPAGIAASLQAKKEKLSFITLDQQDFGGTVLSYPRKKLVMTQPVDFPLYGKLKQREIEKEELLQLFRSALEQEGIVVRAGVKVENVRKNDSFFLIESSQGEYSARRILLAIGRRGSPRKFNIPGEQSDKVFFSLLEPEHFTNSRILVAGGGDSAVEAALALAEQPGNVVHIVYRRENFFRLKENNTGRIEKALAEGRITALFNTDPVKIEKDQVILKQNEREFQIANDFVFIFIGGELPTDFLKKMGIEFARKFGEA